MWLTNQYLKTKA